MNFCPVCKKWAVYWVKSRIKHDVTGELCFKFWRCNHCHREFVEVLDGNSNLLEVNMVERRESVQSTLGDFV